MNIKKMYLKRKILRGIVFITENTPDWVRYYFGPMLYPFFAVYTNRDRTKLQRAVKAAQAENASQEQLVRVVSKNYLLGYEKIRGHRTILKNAIRELASKFLSKKIAWLIVKETAYDFFQENYFSEREIAEFRSIRRKCLQEIIDHAKNKESIREFLKCFGHDNDLPETAKQQLLVKFLKAMSPKAVFQEMIELEKDTSLSFDIYRDEECKELYENRLKRFAKLDFTKDQAEEAFDVFRSTLDSQETIEGFREGDEVNEENYETFIFDQEEREKFKQHYLTGSYYLRKNLIRLVSAWSAEEFNEVLSLKEYFAKRKELRDMVS